jgi:hypothetical protein
MYHEIEYSIVRIHKSKVYVKDLGPLITVFD